MAEVRGTITSICYADGVHLERQVATDGTVTSTYDTAGGVHCARKVVAGNDIFYENLQTGEKARLNVVSKDLRTAFCGSDTFTDVYVLPRCRALEEVDCQQGPCAAR